MNPIVNRLRLESITKEYWVNYYQEQIYDVMNEDDYTNLLSVEIIIQDMMRHSGLPSGTLRCAVNITKDDQVIISFMGKIEDLRKLLNEMDNKHYPNYSPKIFEASGDVPIENAKIMTFYVKDILEVRYGFSKDDVSRISEDIYDNIMYDIELKQMSGE